MDSPTLVYGATTVTLPVPLNAGSNAREYSERAVTRRTLSGYLRTSILSHGYTYQLDFCGIPRDTYDDIVSLWETCVAAGAYPTFTWTGNVWVSANVGRTVHVSIGPAVPTGGRDVTLVNFSLSLDEVNPRTVVSKWPHHWPMLTLTSET